MPNTNRLRNTLTGDARTALDTVLCLLNGATPTIAAIDHAIGAQRAYLATAASYIADRWLPAYALLSSAVRAEAV